VTVRSRSDSEAPSDPEAASDSQVSADSPTPGRSASGGEPLAAPVLPPVIERPAPAPPLVTLRRDQWLAGLVGGVAARFGLDALPARLASALLFLASLFLWLPLAGALLAVYVVCWIALPEEDALFGDE